MNASLVLAVHISFFLSFNDEVIIADFEGADYGSWKVTGTAFGGGPARGTLPGQMHVEGFLGKGLVNSFVGGDGATGTLTSPEITIQRPFVNFLIGGGGYPGETCINLRVGNEVVRTAVGPNTEAGGSERLEWMSWDVAELVGKKATIEIIDNRKGGWGHINVDHIVLSDTAKAVVQKKSLAAEARYLCLPVKTGAPKRRVALIVDGKHIREFDIELTSETPDFVAFADIGRWKGKLITIDAGRSGPESKLLDSISVSNEIPGSTEMYSERHRPQFHFTARRGWLNDPNGLVFYKGEWHLFFQHNPYGWNWGNMHWGHAISKDLMRWRELPEAIYPWSDCKGAAFSGSAIVDAANTSGFKTGTEDVLIAALTDTGAGEALAYSNDRGRSWTMFPGNPVVKHQGRDPKIIWHEPTKKWVMAVYDEHDRKQWIAFYTSPNLKDWQFGSRIEGYFECPDFFEISVDGGTTAKWVLYAADGEYALGSFDGKTFKPEHQGKHRVWHGDFYAAQSYSNAPDNRRVQIGWGRNITFPGMPFNQQMTVPVELSLRTTPAGIRLFAYPVRELESLRGENVWNRTAKDVSGIESLDSAGELLDIEIEIAAKRNAEVSIDVRGEKVNIDFANRTIICGATAKFTTHEGKLKLRLLVDRGSIEAFVNDGEVAISRGVLINPDKKNLRIEAKSAILDQLDVKVHRLQSIWTSAD